MEKQNEFPFELDIQFFAEDEPEDDQTEDEVDQTEVEDDEEGEAGKGKDESPAKDGDDDESKAQSRKENAFFAQKRREAEKAAKEKAEKENQEKERKKAYFEGKVAGLGGINPFTKEKIEDEYDLHIYELMKEINDRGEDPEKGLAKALAEEQRRLKAEKEKAAKADAEAVELAKRNIEDLGKAYPKADAAWFKKAYGEDEKFRNLCDHGFTPKEAYEFLGYDKAEDEEEDEEAKKRRTPSSKSSGKAVKKSILEMDDDDFHEAFKKKYG